MAGTLALCLQWRNGTAEKPGHLLHYGESAGGPADSPNQHYCIIIAFLSLLLSPAFSIPLAWSHSSQRVYLMALRRVTPHEYTCSVTHTHRCPTVPLSPPKLNGLLSFSILIIFSSHLTRRAIICFGNASLRGVICWSRNVLVQTFKQCFTLG